MISADVPLLFAFAQTDYDLFPVTATKVSLITMRTVQRPKANTAVTRIGSYHDPELSFLSPPYLR